MTNSTSGINIGKWRKVNKKNIKYYVKKIGVTAT